MRVIIQPSYEQVSKWAAGYVARRILDFQPSAKKPFVLGLPTGSSPIGMYNELAAMNRKGAVSFKHVITFNMDEYVGLPQDHPESYHSFMGRHLFSRIDIPKKNVNILNGNAPDLDAECARYEQRIRRTGGIRLFIGGIGADGHVAFNEPGSSLTSRTRVVRLTSDTRIVNSRFFDNDPNKVPETALSVGVGTVMDADEVLIIINGPNKARALRHVVEDGVNHMWTVSALQMHPQGIIVCDDEATLELKVGTVRYFKDVEARSLDPATLLK
jgi:glucosamine-6-phosphate deaminase